MINTTVSPDAVNSTSATSAADMSIFACQQQVPYSWIVAVALICIVLAIFLTINMLSFIKPSKKEYKPAMNVGEVWNLPYLVESIRLSEAMMSELSSTLKSHEKKALVVIASAVAIVGFIATKNWCSQLADWLGLVSMIFCVTSVILAIRVVTLMNISFIGLSPDVTFNKHSEIRCTQHSEQEKKDREELCRLCMVILRRYDKTIPVMLNASGKKARRLAFASLCIVIGFVLAIGWLSLKILPIVL